MINFIKQHFTKKYKPALEMYVLETYDCDIFKMIWHYPGTNLYMNVMEKFEKNEIGESTLEIAEAIYGECEIDTD